MFRVWVSSAMAGCVACSVAVRIELHDATTT